MWTMLQQAGCFVGCDSSGYVSVEMDKEVELELFKVLFETTHSDDYAEYVRQREEMEVTGDGEDGEGEEEPELPKKGVVCGSIRESYRRD